MSAYISPKSGGVLEMCENIATRIYKVVSAKMQLCTFSGLGTPRELPVIDKH